PWLICTTMGSFIRTATRRTYWCSAHRTVSIRPNGLSTPGRTNSPVTPEAQVLGATGGEPLPETPTGPPQHVPTGRTPRHRYIEPPIRRLEALYIEMPDGYPMAGQANTISGELYLSSGAESARGLRDKTIRDLAKLEGKGFTIQFDRGSEIGEGFFSKVFRGTYNEQGRHLDVKPSQEFAAKYVELAPNSERERYLYHECEKRTLRSLRHSNIVSYRVAINLGQRVILRNVSDTECGDIVTYRRMFLIMDYADQGTLYQFGMKGMLTDYLTVQFTRELSSAMAYMHDNGVVHQDCHTKNVLVFSAPD
ncbi:unnamed protein product, partial [Medioppia subpectinata]